MPNFIWNITHENHLIRVRRTIKCKAEEEKVFSFWITIFKLTQKKKLMTSARDKFRTKVKEQVKSSIILLCPWWKKMFRIHFTYFGRGISIFTPKIYVMVICKRLSNNTKKTHCNIRQQRERTKYANSHPITSCSWKKRIPLQTNAHL